MKKVAISISIVILVSGLIALVFLLNQPENLEVSSEVQQITASIEPVAPAEPTVDTKETRQEVVVEDKEDVSVIQVDPVVELDVPFIVQAPNADWSERYKETCEEASILMIHKFYEQSGVLTQDQMKAALDPLTDWGDSYFNGRVDTTLEETALYLTKHLGYDVSRINIIEDPTVDDIKALLAKGLPVVIPAAGRELGNKFFQTPGPLYHMLVITGYDRNDFITNDPGTRNGEGYRYNQTVLMNAIHDWTGDGETILEGRQVVLVVTP